jgi:hypothetical protein
MARTRKIQGTEIIEAEETKVADAVVVAKPRWKVLSGGFTLLNKKSYNTGDVFEADEYEIPKAFRRDVQNIDPLPLKLVRKQQKYSLLEVVPTAEEEDAGTFVQLYNIANEAGKIISEKPLSKEEITPLLNELNK